MKKILVLLTTVFVALSMMSFVACGHKHTLSLVDEVAATCTADGTGAYYACSGCEKIFADENAEEELLEVPVLSKLGHSWDDATCTAPKTCSICSATEGEALGHTGGSATCTAKAVCETCQEEYGELAAHVYDQEVVGDAYIATAATCTELGTYFKSCVCGAAGEETFVGGELKAHGKKAILSDDALIGSDALGNNTYFYTCPDCGEITSDSFSFNEYVGITAGMAVSVEEGLNPTIAEGFTVEKYEVYNTAATLLASYTKGDDYAAFNTTVKGLPTRVSYNLKYTVSFDGGELTQTSKFTLVEEGDVVFQSSSAQNGNVKAFNTEIVNVNMVNAVGGKAVAWQWSAVGEGALNDAATVNFSSDALELMTEGKYLSFEIYTTKNIAPIFWNANGDIYYLYNGVQSYGANVKAFDKDGNQITTGDFWNGDFTNQWVTIEIKLNGSMVYSGWRGLSVINATSLPGNSVYLDNFMITDTSRAA